MTPTIPKSPYIMTLIQRTSETGHVHSGFRHELQITHRSTPLGHVLGVMLGAALAAIVVFGWGL